MKILGFSVALFGLLALLLAVVSEDAFAAGLGVTALLCGFTTFRAAAISSFLKIFVAIFSAETILFGLATLAAHAGFWPEAYLDYRLPDALALTVAIFSIVVYIVAHTPVVRQITRIADLYFSAGERGIARIWPLRPFTALERRIAVAMVVFLVVLNQVEVGISVRFSFFNRDWLNAIQNKDADSFWQLLLFVGVPLVFLSVATALIEFFVQAMLIIRWRRWLTDHFVTRWLAGHAHYRMSLAGAEADNPDQRIAEDVNRFIDGGTQGYGIYSYSILLISTLSSLVSFAIVLWVLSETFTVPGINIHVPGLLFWIALVYAGIGTLIAHVIGRSLVGLYFERQRAEASFRFSLARLREYSEQVALLNGEQTEQASLSQRFGAIIRNYIALVDRRKKLLVFTATYGQISPIIPYVVTAPFYFAGAITLGVMTQTADAFERVQGALTFFVNYYSSLADFKSVVNRLTSFDEAIQHATALGAHGPARLAAAAGATPITLDDVGVALPDGRRIVETADLALAPSESVLLAGPSGSGKSTLFRAISGIWPYGGGRIHIPAGARVMVVPQKPYIPIGTLRAAVAYPDAPGAYADEDIKKALADARLGAFADQLDREDAWSQRLSGGEQQRLALARALLTRPDWLFLDESTSALDEKLEADLYAMLAERLPNTTVISIGHRSTLAAFHQRRLDMTAGEGGLFTPRDVKIETAE
ncbi:MAG: vitamin B12/bleomycin/antimicrobial peptide transport system ATP-binding/permease protein [Alphaproteobacteria bacterium]|nr:vitamin B12/bleomycin/antimicrobial peptide transport system ATP-binding/permease protein [Alphaproteobacteria bacterium]